MSDPLENLLRQMFNASNGSDQSGSITDSNVTRRFFNITTADGAPLSLPLGMSMMPGMPGVPVPTRARAGGGGGGGGGGSRGRATPGSPGSVYGGDMPPMAWIQREQQRTPLRFSATGGPARFDGERLREQGNLAFTEQRYDEAVELYTRALQVEPSRETNYTNRSLAYFKLGRFKESAADAREAIRLWPDFYKAYYRLGLALVGMGEYPATLASLRVALDKSPEVNRADIEVAIAKCESKLARASMTPLLMGREGSAAPAGTPLSGPTLRRMFPSVQADFNKLGALVQQAAELRADVAAYTESYSGQKDIVECEKRSKMVKQLMSVATSGRLAELSKEAGDKQEALRRTLKGQDRSLYAEAKQDRDAANQQVWETAGQVQQAIAKLKTIASEEQSFFRRFGAAAATAGSDESAASAARATASATGTPAGCDWRSPTVSDIVVPAEGTFQEMLRRHAAAVFGATDAAADALCTALEDEERAAATLRPLLQEAAGLNLVLEDHARYVAATATKELSDSQLDALNQVSAAVDRVQSDEGSFKKTLAEGDRLLEEEAKLERVRLLFEKQRIQLQAEVEWFKVREELEGKIVALQNQVRILQQRIEDTNKKQKEVQKRILDLVETAHPELAWKSMSSGSRILRLIKGSGLWLNLSFSDFQIVSTLSSTVNSKVYHATRRGEHVAIKEIPINDEQARRLLQREVNIVAGCTHPNIIKIKGVFFDGPFAYILLPYNHRGSLKSLLQKKEPLSWVAVQDMFRQLSSGIVYLHERGVVHGDIKPSNILLSNDNRPIITDFGIAKDDGRFGEGVDLTVTATTTGAVAGTANYMAPEQLAGNVRRSTPKSDIWALGLTFFEVAANNAFFHDPALGEPQGSLADAAAVAAATGTGSGLVDIPAARVGGDEKLVDLVSWMVVADPEKRTTAHGVLGHIYFSSSVGPSQSNKKSAVLAKSDERIEAVRSYLHAFRAAHNTNILVSVSRNSMVGSLRSIIPQLSDSELLEPIMVVFQGEAGIDEGALTSEMLNLFYVEMARDRQALVAANADDDGAAAVAAEEGGAAAFTFMSGTTYLPAEDDKNIAADLFELLGKVLLKNIVENRPLSLQLNSAVLKYFCNMPVSITDLEEFDRIMADSLKRLRLLSSEDLEAAELNFSHFSVSFLASSLHGRYLRETLVTSDNVCDYVNLRVQYDLVEKRKRALEAMKRGLFSVAAIEPHLKLLSNSDLLLLLCGVQHVPAQTIIDALEFQGFPSASNTPQHLKNLLLGMSQNNLRRFLELCTSTAALPATDAMRRIKVLRTGDAIRLPVGHGCVFQLDLPDYNDKKVLEEKLQMALAHVSDGFHIV